MRNANNNWNIQILTSRRRTFAAFGGILVGYETGRIYAVDGIFAMKDWLRVFGEPNSKALTGYAIPSSQLHLVEYIHFAGAFVGTYPIT